MLCHPIFRVDLLLETSLYGGCLTPEEIEGSVLRFLSNILRWRRAGVAGRRGVGGRHRQLEKQVLPDHKALKVLLHAVPCNQGDARPGAGGLGVSQRARLGPDGQAPGGPSHPRQGTGRHGRPARVRPDRFGVFGEVP